MMNGRHLSCFVAIYEAGTISAAAERLRVSISSLSHHLSNLEHELDTTLFTRHRRGMVPTADGMRFYGHACEILGAMQVADTDMRTRGDRIVGHVGVSVTSSAAQAIGFDLVVQTEARYPDVTLSLNAALSNVVIADVIEDRADIGLAFNAQSSEAIRVTPLLTEEMVLVGKPDIVGPNGEPITFDGVLEHRLILLTQGLSAQALTRDKALLKRLEQRANLQVNSVPTVSACLHAGLAATVGTRLIFPVSEGTDRLHARPIVSPLLDRELCLITPRKKVPSYAVEHIRQMVCDLVTESVRQGRWPAQLKDA